MITISDISSFISLTARCLSRSMFSSALALISAAFWLASFTISSSRFWARSVACFMMSAASSLAFASFSMYSCSVFAADSFARFASAISAAAISLRLSRIFPTGLNRKTLNRIKIMSVLIRVNTMVPGSIVTRGRLTCAALSLISVSILFNSSLYAFTVIT